MNRLYSYKTCIGPVRKNASRKLVGAVFANGKSYFSSKHKKEGMGRKSCAFFDTPPKI